MGLRNKLPVTVLAEPPEDELDGFTLVTYSTASARWFADEPPINLDPPASSG